MKHLKVHVSLDGFHSVYEDGAEIINDSPKRAVALDVSEDYSALFAAAPELLAALVKLRGAVDGLGMSYPYLEECKAEAISAITKAS